MELLNWIVAHPEAAFWIAVVGSACLCTIIVAARTGKF